MRRRIHLLQDDSLSESFALCFAYMSGNTNNFTSVSLYNSDAWLASILNMNHYVSQEDRRVKSLLRVGQKAIALSSGEFTWSFLILQSKLASGDQCSLPQAVCRYSLQALGRDLYCRHCTWLVALCPSTSSLWKSCPPLCSLW